METAVRNGIFSQENLEIVRKMITRSGLGPSTYVAKPLLKTPPDLALVEAKKETKMAIFGAIVELLQKTRIETKDIGILVVNFGVFSPTPSLADMVVNRYKLRENILCYNLSGMGCSAGVIGIDLAKELQQVKELGGLPTYFKVMECLKKMKFGQRVNEKASQVVEYFIHNREEVKAE
ncbi:hypothetical protein L6164_016442 [Bauhinia variegata]|uniref:Uncharacterized protein n=1 Tax=Bauhinia variegata TaxID=167791 RepID=A0ACB9NUN0_BAUVA|nr:hypothetical protein L6164_016442 [Bauhinia variegata]